MSASAGLRNCSECNIIVKRGDKTVRCAGLCANKFHWDCVKNDIQIDYESYRDSPNLMWLCNVCLETSDMTSNICLEQIRQITVTSDKQASCLSSVLSKVDELKQIITNLSLELSDIKENNKKYGRSYLSSTSSQPNKKSFTLYSDKVSNKHNSQNNANAQKPRKKPKKTQKPPMTSTAPEDKKDGQAVDHVDDILPTADFDVNNETHPPSAEVNKQDDKINSESDTSSETDSDASVSSLEQFTVVLPKKQKKQSVKKPTTKKVIKVGSNMDAASFSFSAAPRKCWIYLSKLSANTEVSHINEYLVAKFPNKTFIIENVEIHNKNRKAFKIGAEYVLMDALYDVTNWPSGVQIDRYRFPKNLKKT